MFHVSCLTDSPLVSRASDVGRNFTRIPLPCRLRWLQRWPLCVAVRPLCVAVRPMPCIEGKRSRAPGVLARGQLAVEPEAYGSLAHIVREDLQQERGTGRPLDPREEQT